MRYFLLLLVSFQAFAELPVCVRNYVVEGKGSACDFSTSHTWVPHLNDAEKKVCARIYSDFYCQMTSKEYLKIKAVDGRSICVLNNNQPPVANLCESTPDFYDYVQS